MAKKEKELDQLTKDCISANEAGMSYGQWKAMQPVEQKKPKIDREFYKRCPACGEYFVIKGTQGGRKIYCNLDCRQRALWMKSHGVPFFEDETDEDDC